MPQRIRSVFQRLMQKITRCFTPSKIGAEVQGFVKFFDKKKGFGFVVSGNKEYFFNTAATNPNNFRALKEGVKVKFVITQGKKGLQAKKIELV